MQGGATRPHVSPTSDAMVMLPCHESVRARREGKMRAIGRQPAGLPQLLHAWQLRVASGEGVRMRAHASSGACMDARR